MKILKKILLAMTIMGAPAFGSDLGILVDETNSTAGCLQTSGEIFVPEDIYCNIPVDTFTEMDDNTLIESLNFKRILASIINPTNWDIQQCCDSILLPAFIALQRNPSTKINAANKVLEFAIWEGNFDLESKVNAFAFILNHVEKTSNELVIVRQTAKDLLWRLASLRLLMPFELNTDPLIKACKTLHDHFQDDIEINPLSTMTELLTGNMHYPISGKIYKPSRFSIESRIDAVNFLETKGYLNYARRIAQAIIDDRDITDAQRQLGKDRMFELPLYLIK